MSKCVDYEDVKMCVELAIKSGMSLEQFREHMDLWTDFVEGQRWIPCSERLPKFMEPVLTWDGACYCVEKRIPYITDTDGEHIEADWWVSDDYDADNSEYYPNLRDGACIAWMPLPEPYQEEQK